jgi:hypothetical protein
LLVTPLDQRKRHVNRDFVFFQRRPKLQFCGVLLKVCGKGSVNGGQHRTWFQQARIQLANEHELALEDHRKSNSRGEVLDLGDNSFAHRLINLRFVFSSRQNTRHA